MKHDCPDCRCDDPHVQRKGEKPKESQWLLGVFFDATVDCQFPRQGPLSREALRKTFGWEP